MVATRPGGKMSKTKCCNCGAALNIFAPKCEFCGTKNINMTEIDLASGEAANFIFKLPDNIKIETKEGTQLYMSMLAVPELTAIEMTYDDFDVYGGPNYIPLATYRRNTEFKVGLNLRAASHSDTNELCSLTIK